jgi:hypothetical protein
MNKAEHAEKLLWETWLDDKYDNSSTKMEKIRNAVKRLYNTNKNMDGELPYFTLHDTTHCDSVENMLHKLIPGDKHQLLSTREKYYLLVGAWVHDIGVLPCVVSRIYKKETALDEYEIRKRHHMTSELFIANHWSELEIDEIDKEVIGKLIRFHRRSEDINECDEVFIVRKEKIRLRLLSGYLRLADALDISVTRAPAENYALCLAYNMSDDSKFHWIKSRLVVGVFPDEKEHVIRITFKYPKQEYLVGYVDYNTAKNKLDNIKKLVVDDLRDELMSVMNVIIKEDIAYYLDIFPVTSEICYDERMMNDLREIVINYDIMGAPSDSKLLEFIFCAVANLAGYSLRKNDTPIKFENVKSETCVSVNKKISSFLEVIEKRVIRNRPYPVGLINAVNDIRDFKSINCANEKNSIEEYVYFVNNMYSKHLYKRKMIRMHSKELFDSISLKDGDKKIVLLLYGFSELATKCICGLRDMLIDLRYGSQGVDIYEKIYGSDLESDISNKVMIYICECQPKTQTYVNDRILYHDGAQYALHLKKYGFNNIVIIPDIMAAAIAEKIIVDYLIIGANGLSEKHFIHSPGLSSIVSIVKTCAKGRDRNTKIILATISDKYDKNKIRNDIRSDVGYDIVEGNIFYSDKMFGINRKNIWMCRDAHLMRMLYQKKIAFSNPLEDEILYEGVDYIVTEKGWANNSSEKNWFEKIIV